MSELEQLIEKIVDRRLEERLAERVPAQPALVTVADFARSRSISQSTVRAAIRESRLNVTRIGRVVRIASDEEIRRRSKVLENDALMAKMRAKLLSR